MFQSRFRCSEGTLRQRYSSLRFFHFYTYKRLGCRYIKDSCTHDADQALQQLPYTPTAKHPAAVHFGHTLLETTYFLFLIQNKLFRVKIAIHYDPVANPNMEEQYQ